LSEVFRNLDLSVLTDMLYKVIPALLCVVFHELSHGYVALRLGDRTAKEMGRLSLNPIRHVDIIGLLMMVTVGFGWAKPVPIDPYHFKKPEEGHGRNGAGRALVQPAAGCCLSLRVRLSVSSAL
jgi:Zn-dependent protease